MSSLKTIEASQISVIIPVKDNQRGVDRFLCSFFETQSPESFPQEIIIVDNNSKSPISISKEFKGRGVKVVLLICLKIGPASARNVGARHAKGKWLLFVDSDCISTKSMITGYLAQDDLAVGYQGFVAALGMDYLSSYYMSQQIHLPPSDPNGSPKYLVTANSLMIKEAFMKVGGFNENFKMAGGEDIELAIRLAKEGQLSYARESRIKHDFNDGLSGFVKRFVRYGKGHKLIENLSSIKFFPLPFTAKQKLPLVNNFLVVIQWLCLLWGYLSMSKSTNTNEK